MYNVLMISVDNLFKILPTEDYEVSESNIISHPTWIENPDESRWGARYSARHMYQRFMKINQSPISRPSPSQRHPDRCKRDKYVLVRCM